MTTFLILGGYGFTGKLLAHYLLDRSDALIIISGRNLDKAQTFSDELNHTFPGQRVRPLRVDAGDYESLIQAFPQADMVIVAAPTTQHTQTVVRAVLESKIDYLDVQYSPEKLSTLKANTEKIREAGLCFVTEAGYHPGLIAALIRYAARDLSSLDSAHVGGLLNMGSSLPYSEAVDELIDALKTYQAQVYKNGTWTKAGTFSTRKFDFGEPFGVRGSFSMFFEELTIIPRLFPGVQNVGFYMAETHWFVDYVISMIVMYGIKLFPRAVKPLGKLMWWGMQTFPKPPYGVKLQADVYGVRDERPTIIRTSIFHTDGYALTAIPVVAYLLQYMDGSARRPGLWVMGEIVDPIRLIHDIKALDTKITIEEEIQ